MSIRALTSITLYIACVNNHTSINISLQRIFTKLPDLPCGRRMKKKKSLRRTSPQHSGTFMPRHEALKNCPKASLPFSCLHRPPLKRILRADAKQASIRRSHQHHNPLFFQPSFLFPSFSFEGGPIHAMKGRTEPLSSGRGPVRSSFSPSVQPGIHHGYRKLQL